jgi:predicted RNase H-like HicB family nuclease
MTSTKLAVTRYHATFDLDESGVWIAELDEIPQVHTFGRTLGKAREYLVDALALWLDVPSADVKNSIDFRRPNLPAAVQSLVDESIAARAMSEAATKTAAEIMAAAALALTGDARLSHRDAAELLGVSHQRVQQLIAQGQGGNLVPIGSGLQGVAQDIARSLKEFLPGGPKEELGALAAGVALGFTIAWAQSRE